MINSARHFIYCLRPRSMPRWRTLTSVIYMQTQRAWQSSETLALGVPCLAAPLSLPSPSRSLDSQPPLQREHKRNGKQKQCVDSQDLYSKSFRLSEILEPQKINHLDKVVRKHGFSIRRKDSCVQTLPFQKYQTRWDQTEKNHGFPLGLGMMGDQDEIRTWTLKPLLAYLRANAPASHY